MSCTMLLLLLEVIELRVKNRRDIHLDWRIVVDCRLEETFNRLFDNHGKKRMNVRSRLMIMMQLSIEMLREHWCL